MSFRVLSAQIAHETNTFSVKRTTLDDYRARSLYLGDAIAAAFRGTRTELGAHLDAAKRLDWNLVQPIAASATPSGRTTQSAWAAIRDTVFAAVERERVDGVLLALHGAMAAEGEDDCEGALLAGIRERIGERSPIVATLDLHANVSDAMASHANALLAYRTYPHIDQYEVGCEAADLLDAAMRGLAAPHARVWRLPTLDGCDHGRTGSPTMARILALANTVKATSIGCLTVAVCAGFPWADVAFAGPSVTLTWNGAVPRSDIAAPLLEEIWKSRAEISVRLETPAAAAEAAKHWNGPGALVLADFTDNPGGGGYGDSVGLLSALVDAQLPNAAFAAIADPKSVEACCEAGLGATLALSLGSKIDPIQFGPPLLVRGKVESLGNGAVRFDGPMMQGMQVSLGPTAVLRVDGLKIVIATNNVQAFDRQIFLSQGIDPAALAVIGVKSAHHFRSAFEPLAGCIMLVDGGGLVSPDLKRLRYKRVRRPIWPLDHASAWP